MYYSFNCLISFCSSYHNARKLLLFPLFRGYCAPEYLDYGKRSAKSDIYSLGVIIMELVTGSKLSPCCTKVSAYHHVYFPFTQNCYHLIKNYFYSVSMNPIVSN